MSLDHLCCHHDAAFLTGCEARTNPLPHGVNFTDLDHLVLADETAAVPRPALPCFDTIARGELRNALVFQSGGPCTL